MRCKRTQKNTKEKAVYNSNPSVSAIGLQQYLWRGRIVWLSAPVLKTGNPKGFVGSNPTLSAIWEVYL